MMNIKNRKEAPFNGVKSSRNLVDNIVIKRYYNYGITN